MVSVFPYRSWTGFQVGRKFIILRASTGAILCVDQHAADERIKLEDLEQQASPPTSVICCNKLSMHHYIENMQQAKARYSGQFLGGHILGCRVNVEHRKACKLAFPATPPIMHRNQSTCTSCMAKPTPFKESMTLQLSASTGFWRKRRRKKYRDSGASTIGDRTNNQF